MDYVLQLAKGKGLILEIECDMDDCCLMQEYENKFAMPVIILQSKVMIIHVLCGRIMNHQNSPTRRDFAIRRCLVCVQNIFTQVNHNSNPRNHGPDGLGH